jgi:hypothetical protein
MSPTEHELVTFFIILFSALGGLWLIIQIVQSLRRSPPIDREFATKDEVALIKEEVGARIDNLEVHFDDLKAALEVGLKTIGKDAALSDSKLHHRVDQILAVVSEIRGRCAAFHGNGGT